MTKEQLVRNNRGIDDGADLPRAMLEAAYDRITANPITITQPMRRRGSIAAAVAVAAAGTSFAAAAAAAAAAPKPGAVDLDIATFTNPARAGWLRYVRWQPEDPTLSASESSRRITLVTSSARCHIPVVTSL